MKINKLEYLLAHMLLGRSENCSVFKVSTIFLLPVACNWNLQDLSLICSRWVSPKKGDEEKKNWAILQNWEQCGLVFFFALYFICNECIYELPKVAHSGAKQALDLDRLKKWELDLPFAITPDCYLVSALMRSHNNEFI